MNNPNPKNTEQGIPWFIKNLPTEYLDFPEHYLYSVALEVEGLEDVTENRRLFKQLLVSRLATAGRVLPQVDGKQLKQFMDSGGVERAEELLKLTEAYLAQVNDITEAQRLALTELFHKEAPLTVTKMDEAYFNNRELVEADLNAFLEHATKNSIADLLSSNPKWGTSITAQNGEMVQWETYLNRASGVLFGTKQGSDNPHRKSDTLLVLKKLCDATPERYDLMNEAYFKDRTKVEADLNAFLELSTKNSIADLLPSNPKWNASITAQNGGAVTWNTYLNRASSVFFGTTGTKKGGFYRNSDALLALQKLCEAAPEHYASMDETYFKDRTMVEADLNAFLEHAKGNSIADLLSNNPKSNASITAHNGETVKWTTYLNRASATLLGTKEKSDNPPRPPDALFALQKLCAAAPERYDSMDKVYFKDRIKVEADLNAFLEHAKGNSITDLTTNNPKPNASITAHNGEPVKWATYLNRASATLLGTKEKSDNPPPSI